VKFIGPWSILYPMSLNEEQLLAVHHIHGPLLVLAGAGSGKTRVVTFRIAYLIEHGVAPHEICAVTFTNKAANEMKERIHLLLKNASSSPTICTFHSLGVRILRESIHHLGYQGDFVIYDEEDTNKLLKNCMQSFTIPREASQFKIFRNLISHSKNQLLPPHEVNTSDHSHITAKLFPEVYKLYQERLLASNALDFDDLLFLTVKLFQEHPKVLSLYQERWPYLLIDEYQDTNRAQYTIAKLLVAKSANLFVVGDPDQSIYSWRGANMRNILNFERDFPGAKVVRLEQNYRSKKNILDAANALIQNNSGRYEKKLYSNKDEGSKILCFIGEDEHDEAEFVTNEISRLHRQHQIPLKEITIFYRTNFQSRIFEDYLLRKRIPYVIIGGISFYQRKEIKDILAFLRLVISDHDLIAFGRTINLPKRGLGDTTLEKLYAFANESELPIISACRAVIQNEESGILRGKQKASLQEYLDMIDRLRVSYKEGHLQEIVSETIRESRYFDYLQEDKETFEDRKNNVTELVSKAYDFEKYNEHPTLTAFLEELSLKSNIDEADMSDDKLNLMTLHNGKGLEFNTIFLVGLEEDLLPHINCSQSDESLEEERRLCYVGITRAKERLYFSCAKTRFLWGTHRSMRTSRFLREVPKHLLTRVT
jgi:DNA helicase-2/ATP-dependent DNA helicase PcrA